MPLRRVSGMIGSFALGLLVLPAAAGATTITFADLSTPSLYTALSIPKDIDGLHFATAGPFYAVDGATLSTTTANDGTTFIIAPQMNLFLPPGPGACSGLACYTSGAPFNLTSIDLGLSNITSDSGTDTLDVTGYFANGSSVTHTYTLTDSFTTEVISDFHAVTAVSTGFLPHGGYIAFDNLNYSVGGTFAAPEPASLALLAGGVAGIGLSRRRPR